MRDQHWPTRLAEFLETKRRQPFAWGSNDCCLFASDGIKAMTGIDPAEDIRGRYYSALGAARILNAQGGMLGLVESKCTAFGWKEISPLTAQRGDLVVAALKGGDTCGIVIGGKVAFAGPNGLHLENLTRASRAWRIN